MKLNKYFMLGLAGLAFAACSSEEDATNGMEGNGVVEVKIVNPTTRSLTTPTSTAEVIVTRPITVKLTAGTGSGQQTIDPTTGGTHTVKFYGVKNPSLIEAWVNAGNEKADGTTEITKLQMKPNLIPAYGSNETFTFNGKLETSDGKSYEMYEATVTMQIPVARLEVSGITHVTHPVDGDPEEATCKYQTLTIDGIYLDKVRTTATGTDKDYCMPAGESDTPEAPILFDAIEGSPSFLEEGKVWPADANLTDDVPENVYAYNFYPQGKPILKIYFATATGVEGDNGSNIKAPRYAMIKSYNGTDPDNFKFEAGKIYQIKDIKLKDKNIIGDEEGNTLYGVDVTVVEAKWSVTELDNSTWVEQ